MSSQGTPIKYRRFTRGSLALIMRCSLWLSDEHLLSVKSTGYTEDYLRVYIKDLKGIVACHTRTWMVVNSLLGIVLLLFGIGILRSDDIFSAGTIALALFGLPFLIAFVVNLAKGPTCKTNLLTPLGPVEIPALNRSRMIPRLIKELRPLIVARQGSMLRSELLTRYDRQRTGVTSAPEDPQ